MLDVNQALHGLAHLNPHFGWGQRFQQSANGSWLNVRLDRDRRIEAIVFKASI